MFLAPLPACVLNCFNAIVPPSFLSLCITYLVTFVYVIFLGAAIYAIAIWLLIPVWKTVYMNIILSTLDTQLVLRNNCRPHVCIVIDSINHALTCLSKWLSKLVR